MRLERLAPEFVGLMPDVLVDGVLYISREFELAIHLCACGCGIKTVTPTHAGEWTLTVSGGEVSLSPSIGNQNFPCGSHYWIRNNRVEWA